VGPSPPPSWCAGAAKELTAAGVEVAKVEPTCDVGALRDVQAVLRGAGVRAGIAASPDPAGPLSPPVQAVADMPFDATAADFAAAMRALTAFRREVSVVMSAYDALLLPTTPTWAWSAASPRPDTIAGQPVGVAGGGSYTAWVNAVGYPALSVPVAPTANGLPIGVQLVARAGGDQILLDLAEHVGTPMPLLSQINRTHDAAGQGVAS
jgi:aspartyl-tRNA(Asn)/glutamyl-tRNA(Gln) amidotransferase subunit A